MQVPHSLHAVGMQPMMGRIPTACEMVVVLLFLPSVTSRRDVQITTFYSTEYQILTGGLLKMD